MIRLVPRTGPDAGRPVELEHGARLGRLADCELPIAHASVSRLHARVEARGATYFLVDAGSRNGLFDGAGRRVDEVELAPGAHLRLGEFELEVATDAVEGASATATGTTASTTAGAAPIDEDLEFEFDDDDASGAAADGDGGLELEDPAEIDLGGTARPRTQPGGRTATASSAPAAASASRPSAGGAADAARERSARFLAEESRARSGLVRGELTQQPIWVQGLVFAGVLLFGAAIAFGIYSVVA